MVSAEYRKYDKGKRFYAYYRMDRNRYPRRGAPYRAANVGHTAHRDTVNDNCLCANQPIALAMAYVKAQPFEEIYPLCEGWKTGTIFPSLYKPYCAGGYRR